MISQLEKEIIFRFLKARKKDGFLNVISIFSFIGIGLGVAVLIIVMSVMNGFRTELINKIVGFNAHAVVKPYDTPLIHITDKVFKKGIVSNDGEAVILSKLNTKGVLLKGYLKDDFKKLEISNNQKYFGSTDLKNNSISIGKDLSFLLNIDIGDQITIMSPTGVQTIVGPSGCGKTTLLNIAAGFLRPTSGNITLNGKEIDGPGVERGMVFQQGALFEWLTVAENVNFGLRMKKKDPIETSKKVDEWLEIVGLKGFGNTPTYQLSGGMQQRVALARCLINDPDLILMDEPLGALDALTREKMQSLVLKIWKETGKTIILITHSVEEALLLGERLYVMAPRPGRIHKEYNLPFAEMGLKEDLREIKKNKDFSSKREEILSMIWNMEEEIMGKEN